MAPRLPMLALVLATAAGCATASGPPIQRGELLGRTYGYEAVIGEPVVGTVTFRPDGRMEIRCQGAPERRDMLPGRERFTEVEIPVCDATLTIRRRDDGRLYGIVERAVTQVRGMTERCVRWITDEDGQQVCVQQERGDVTSSRKERVEIELTRVVGGG